MNYKCLGDRIVIKPVEKKEMTDSGLTLLENDRKQEPIGEVMSVGSGVPLHNIKLNITGDLSEEALTKLESIVQIIEKGREMRVKVGDKVQYGAMAGCTVVIDDEKYVLVREADVFGIITG